MNLANPQALGKQIANQTLGSCQKKKKNLNINIAAILLH
ncbi:MAG: hypothetical protein JWM28_2410 [Chitinophagaceae bacterium]|nr:hypothetical protein [Chitinophagaceae bacterium]